MPALVRQAQAKENALRRRVPVRRPLARELGEEEQTVALVLTPFLNQLLDRLLFACN